MATTKVGLGVGEECILFLCAGCAHCFCAFHNTFSTLKAHVALVVIETSRPNLTLKLKLDLEKGGKARYAGEGPRS